MTLSTPSRAAAFTLIEMVVSAALMAVILASGYLCLSSGFSSQQLIDARAEAVQSGRVALALISADLRAACVLSKDIEFLGMDRMLEEVEADNLDFATHNYHPRRRGEGDFCQVSYYLGRNESGDYSLFRRRNPVIAPDPLVGGSKEEIVSSVRGLRFEYYDGIEWFDEWGDPQGKGKAQASFREHPNLTGMPEAVRITLWIEPGKKGKSSGQLEEASEDTEPDMVFQTVARLNLAPVARTGGAETTTTTSDTRTPQPASSSAQGGDR